MLRDVFSDNINSAVDWFVNGGGCEIGIDVGLVLIGWGAVRAFLKNVAGDYINEVLKHATKSQKTDAIHQILQSKNNLSVLTALGGIVVGETINDYLCDKLRQLVNEQG